MTGLLEPSLTFLLVLMFLVVAAILLAAMWVATARREPLWGAALVILLVPLLWLVERMVVTDREEVEATLHEIAADVKSNNRAAVLAHIHSGAPSLKQRAQAEIHNYTFTECKVNKLHSIEVNAADDPPSAEAQFNVYVSGTFILGNQTFTGDAPRRIVLKLRKESDGRWRVEDYAHFDPFPRSGGAAGSDGLPGP